MPSSEVFEEHDRPRTGPEASFALVPSRLTWRGAGNAWVVDGDATAQPGTPPAAASAPGWVLADRYRVRERLGTGATSDVFRATDERLGRDVAIKVFPAIVGDADAIQRHERELGALASLSHPNLVSLYDAHIGAEDGPDFLVMELVEGPTLSARLREGPMDSEQTAVLGAQVADALAYIHGRAIVHRDVKPGNILLGSSDEPMRARLSDFGVARGLGTAPLTATGQVLGTACYMAPEQVRGQGVSPAADVYALGLVLLEALTGERCYDGPPVEAAIKRLSTPPRIPVGLDPVLADLLSAMTSADPQARPSAHAVAQSLQTRTSPISAGAVGEHASLSEPMTAVTAPLVDAPRERTRRRGLKLLIAAGLAACASTGVIVAFSSPTTQHPPTLPSETTRVGTTHPRTHHTTSNRLDVVAPPSPHASSATTSRSTTRSSSVVPPPTTTTSTTAPATSPAASTSDTSTQSTPPPTSSAPLTSPSTSAPPTP